MPTEPQRRQKKSINNRKLLLQSALELFSQYGYDKVTVDDIVERVGMSKGSFYNLFQKKGDLIVYRSEILGEDVMNRYHKMMRKKGYAEKPAVEKIRDFICTMLKTSVESSNYPFLSQMFISVMSQPPEDAKNYYEQHQTDELIKQVIMDGQEKGELRDDIDPDSILRSIHVFQRGVLLEWCYKEGKYDIIERNTDTIEIFCRGLCR